MHDDDADELLRLVPRWLVGTLAQRAEAGAPVAVPVVGAVLFADISGFSTLTETLFQRKGAGGIDQLVAALDHTFDPLVEAVHAHGGEVAAFAGDAAMAWWPATEGVPLSDVVGLAAQCALAVQEQMATLPPMEGVSMGLRQVVTAGPLVMMRVGGGRHPWQTVLTGALMGDMGPALSAIAPGEVGLMPAAQTANPTLLTAGGDAKPARLVGVGERPQVEPPAVLRAWGRPASPDEARASLDSALHARLQAVGWTFEMRSTTPLFLEIKGTEAPALGWLQPVIAALQRCLADRGGQLLEVLCDDKGLVCVGAFGLPAPVELRPEAPVLAALEFAEQARAMRVDVAIGIASGKTFFGAVGGRSRAAFGLTGSTMNLAARMMGQGPGVFVDAPSARAAQSAARFAAPRHQRFKGFDDPIAVHEALGPAVLDGPAPVGRDGELASARDGLDALTAGRGGLWVVEGPPGCGKSVLLGAVTAEARARGLAVLSLHATPARSERAFAAWAPALLLALGDEPLEAWLEQGGADPALAPLLLPLLGRRSAETERTSTLRGFVRAMATADLLADTLGASGPHSVLLAEDLQWLDGPSLALLERFVDDGALVLGSVRTRGGSSPGELGRLLARAERHALRPHSHDGTRALVRQALSGQDPPPSLVDWLQTRAGGRAHFTLELLGMLEERGALSTRGGVMFFDAAHLGDFTPPPTVEAALASRVDPLPAATQRVLRIASAIGVQVDEAALAATCDAEGQPETAAAIAALVDAGLLERSPEGLRFASQTLRQTVHGTLVRAQRERIHAALAHHYQARAAGGGVHPATLAWHWGHTSEAARAQAAFEQAWAQAMREGSMRAAARWSVRALDAADDAEERGLLHTRPLDRARWRYRIALACRASGETARAQEELETALDLLGHAEPSTPSGWRWHLGGVVLGALVSVLLPETLRRGQDDGRRQVEAGVLSLLSLLCFLAEGQPEALLARALRAVTLSRRCHHPAPTAIAYTMVGAALGPHPRLARRVLAEGSARAARSGDPREVLDAALGSLLAGLAQARWAETEAISAEVRPLLDASGGEHLRGVILGLLGCIAWCRGDVGLVEETAAAMVEIADEQGDPLPRGWALGLQATLALHEGRVADAVALTGEAEVIFGLRSGGADSITARSMRSRALAASGDHEAATRLAQGLLADLGEARIIPVTGLEAYAGVAEVALMLPTAHPDAAGLLDGGIDLMSRFAKAHPIGRPRALRYRAARATAQGEREAARVLVGQSRDAAHALRMPLELAAAERAQETG